VPSREGSPARSAITKRGDDVGANARSSFKAVASGDGLEGAVGESNGGKTLRTANEHASARNAPIRQARALLIYLKHRGVLNVEEFRRTNARSL
jgi:hypothetical protein